ncbi:hypothetical protein Q4497_00295 [Mesomycoplasma ovipneumoniae]|uniref:Preprotein translocase subunit SecE n=1 Tax=Mesomycoplasma ovipneumoniae TaxID=29562 RepID=A0AAW6Q4B7_9BACT|nr:hypothetical protein [Mesomycoplasma ovipneumoniae]MDF9627430.1 hypothetical protein [Mesomycoplasma ovipneumoniae]MDO4157459.1 hypothetical protein [Mesomycoplasma ovipneumoniae]MDO4158545.1 hypothetical protein [Mesomycoplasma ovipneumoniae]MDO6821466.1 hypothetical protein [Mesomycoplasma ovipneumoniae]MDO6855831.1 hypothetical protein [Mesomycoplasma ovipneumoniae]
MAYHNDAAQLLKSTKSWANKLLIVRLAKFVLGTITFIVFIAGITASVGRISISPRDTQETVSAILAPTTIAVVMFVFWLFLSLGYWISLIISPFKLHDLPRRMNLKNVHFVSKFQGIFVLSIVAIFIIWVDIIYLIMLRSFISRSEKELIEDSLD